MSPYMIFIQIVDPGSSCFIAIGLARKDYPKNRHPGWNKGSIAYHADDGKVRCTGQIKIRSVFGSFDSYHPNFHMTFNFQGLRRKWSRCSIWSTMPQRRHNGLWGIVSKKL